jgi:hypothetical protein
VAQVLYPTLSKRALGALQEQTVGMLRVEDGADVLQMLREGRAVYHNVVKEHEHKATKEGAKNLVPGHWSSQTP